MSTIPRSVYLFAGLISILVGLIAALMIAGLFFVLGIVFVFDSGADLDFVDLFVLALIPGLVAWIVTTVWYFRRSYKGLAKVASAFVNGAFSLVGALVGVAIVGTLIIVGDFSGAVTGIDGIMGTVGVVLCILFGGVTGGLWRR